MNVTVDEFGKLVRESKEDEVLKAFDVLWTHNPDYHVILDEVENSALSSFSHRFSSIHVPKEHEYLQRFIGETSEEIQKAFLKRYLEYLIWSPKYQLNVSEGLTSGIGPDEDLGESFISAADNGRAMPALYYINEVAGRDLDAALNSILRMGCIDVSQAIGHYFSCTESVIKLGKRAGLPSAKNHILSAVLYMMQSEPLRLSLPERPESKLSEILSSLIKKSGFVEYHYMILANGLIRERQNLGETYFLQALAGLEKIILQLNEGMSKSFIDKTIDDNVSTDSSISSIQESIWKGDRSTAFSRMRSYLAENGVTNELKNGILYCYTRIKGHPHDPHYVTAPESIFELIDFLDGDEVELAVAHTINFAVNRILRNGLLP